MDNKYNNQSINRLDIEDKILKVLDVNNIKTIGKLCGKTKTDLKKYDLTQAQINKVEIELQLLGLNLKNNL